MNTEGKAPRSHPEGFLDESLRPLVYNRKKIYGPHVKEGMAALDTGCGAGFNTIGIARLVGPSGSVDASDVDPAALATLGKRAAKYGLSDRINIVRCGLYSIGVSGEYDFVNAFWMVHELPDRDKYLREAYEVMKPGGRLLISEPKFHVKKKAFDAMVESAGRIGFRTASRPRLIMCMTIVLEK